MTKEIPKTHRLHTCENPEPITFNPLQTKRSKTCFSFEWVFKRFRSYGDLYGRALGQKLTSPPCSRTVSSTTSLSISIERQNPKMQSLLPISSPLYDQWAQRLDGHFQVLNDGRITKRDLHSLQQYRKVPQGKVLDQDPCNCLLEIAEIFEKSWTYLGSAERSSNQSVAG